jgi:3'-phosphoadenosine 5'-phosphosulfate sulfotransferase (PAPS reductase)/FAD synthetase
MKYAVQISGGLTSAWALKRTIEVHGLHNTEGYFADTKGKKDADNPHAGEDQDSYRFIREIAKHFQVPIWRVADGRNIWDVMHDNRCIKIPKQDHVPCSKELKAQMLDDVILTRYAPDQVTLVFGMQWDEVNRMERLRINLPCTVWFPLAEKPYVDKEQIKTYFTEHGISVPRLYDLGFEHNNCGGFCVRAGKAHFARLWYTMPERYLYHEERERELQKYLQKDVTIMTEVVKGVKRRLSMQEFRERLQSGTAKYDPLDYGACGCFLAGKETSN